MGYRFIGAWKQESGRRNLESLPILPICAVWVEIPNKQPRKSLPFSEFCAIWVENSNKLDRESLPYFADLCCLGRDSQEAAPEISTLFRVSRHLGREFQ